jgi:hypothetical protein
MTRAVVRLTVVALLVGALSTEVHAQFIVFDPANYVEDLVQVLQLIQQVQSMLYQARRLPVDMQTRYHVVSPAWSLHDLAAGLRYAGPILQAFNAGDPSGSGYRRVVDPLEIPDDILGHMPAALQRDLATAYATIELADGVATLGVDQAGAARASGNIVLQRIQAMENDAVSANDDFHTQTALLNKINAASVLGLRIGEQANQFLAGAIEQLVVDNTRKRDTEARLMDATITEWRYGLAYGADLFRHTATDLDTWRLR